MYDLRSLLQSAWRALWRLRGHHDDDDDDDARPSRSARSWKLPRAVDKDEANAADDDDDETAPLVGAIELTRYRQPN